MKYLVIGNAQMETITQSETGLSRDHVGGVGAIMARELALAGANVTLVTTAPSGPATREVQEAIEDSGIKPLVIPGNPPQTRRGYAHITTHKGNVPLGQGRLAPDGIAWSPGFPSQSGLDPHLTPTPNPRT